LLARADIRIGIAERVIHIHIEQACIRGIIPVAADDTA